jgi:hypothetical protein
MKKLLEAFLDLPTWQGLLVIVFFVALEFAGVWWASWSGYRRGRLDSDAGHLRFDTQQRQREAASRL